MTEENECEHDFRGNNNLCYNCHKYIDIEIIISNAKEQGKKEAAAQSVNDQLTKEGYVKIGLEQGRKEAREG